MDVSALFTEEEVASLLGHANDADTDPHLQFQAQLLEMTLRLESSEKQDVLTRLFANDVEVMDTAEATAALKDEGNACVARQECREACSHYSRALHLLSSEDSSTAAILYNNRSACLHHLGLFERALDDAARALSVSPKYGKAHCRRGEALFSLNDLAGARAAFASADVLTPGAQRCLRTMEIYPSGTSPASRISQRLDCVDDESLTAGLHSSVRVKSSVEKGRHLVTMASLLPGDCVLSEKPSAAVLAWAHRAPSRLSEHSVAVCAWCFEPCHAQAGGGAVIACVPCHACKHVCYCSSSCREQAWDAYHHLECRHRFLRELPDETLLGFYLYASTTAMTTTTTTTTTTATTTTTTTMTTNTTTTSPATVVNNVGLMRPRAVLELQLQAWLVATYWARHGSTPDADSEPHRRAAVFGSLFLNMCRIKCNVFAITRIEDGGAGEGTVESLEHTKVALAVYPMAAMLNHACVSNTAVSFQGRRIVVRSAHALAPEVEVVHCYGPQHGEMPTMTRQNALREQYHFSCACSACQRGDDSFTWFACQEKACTDGALRPVDDTLVCTRCGRTCKDTARLRKFQQRAEEYFAQGQSLLDGTAPSDHREATRVLRHCLEIRQVLLFRNHLKLGATFDTLARAHVQLGEWQEALKLTRSSIALLENVFGSDSAQVARELVKEAQILLTLGQVAACARAVERGVRVLSMYESPHQPSLHALLALRNGPEILAERST